MAWAGRNVLKEEEVHANSGTMKELDQIEGSMVARALDIDKTAAMRVKKVQNEAQNSNY